MKYLIVILVLTLYSCQTTEKKEQVNGKSEYPDQKDSLEISDNLPVFPMKKIKIQVYYTSSYCGGAPPSEEILADAAKKRWFQNSGIKIKSNTADEFMIPVKTNNEGMAEVELPYGNYSVLLDTSLSEQMSHLFNTKCKVVLDKVWKKFTVSENGLNGPDAETLWVVFDFECDPCDPSIKMRP